MRRLLWALLLGACVTAPLASQTNQGELFGGYSFERIAPGCGTNYRCSVTAGSSTSLSGWIASLTGYVYKSFGLTGEVTGGYNGAATLSYTTVNRYTYQLGPTYAVRLRQASAFAHALFGAVSQQASADQSLSYRKFLWSVGAGVDLRVSRRLSIRAAQIDYERQRVPIFTLPDTTSNGFRYSAGVVLRF